MIKKWVNDSESESKAHFFDASINEFHSHAADFDLMIVCDEYSLNTLLKIDEFCLEKQKKWINVGCLESLGYFHFNFKFITTNERFTRGDKFFIKNISKSNPGVITLHQKHSFLRGDFI